MRMTNKEDRIEAGTPEALAAEAEKRWGPGRLVEFGVGEYGWLTPDLEPFYKAPDGPCPPMYAVMPKTSNEEASE